MDTKVTAANECLQCSCKLCRDIRQNQLQHYRWIDFLIEHPENAISTVYWDGTEVYFAAADVTVYIAFHHNTNPTSINGLGVERAEVLDHLNGAEIKIHSIHSTPLSPLR